METDVNASYRYVDAHNWQDFISNTKHFRLSFNKVCRRPVGSLACKIMIYANNCVYSKDISVTLCVMCIIFIYNYYINIQCEGALSDECSTSEEIFKTFYFPPVNE